MDSERSEHDWIVHLTTSLVEPSEDHMAEIRSAVTDSIKSSAGKLLAKRL